jgi:hypothetical protein
LLFWTDIVYAIRGWRCFSNTSKKGDCSTTYAIVHDNENKVSESRFSTFLDTKIRVLVYILIGVFMTIISYLSLQDSTVETFWTWYFEYAPNRYRLMQQILLRLSSDILSLGMLHVIVWGISITLTFIIIRPNIPETIGLSILAWMMSVQLLILSAPGYVLLSLFCKTRDYKYSILLLPCIILFKEFLFYSAIMMLLLLPSVFSRKQLWLRAVLGGIQSVVAYCIMIIIMGPIGAAPGGTPLVTVFYVIQVLQTSWLNSAITFLSIILFSFVFVVRRKKDLILIPLLIAPIFILGFFWEPQLWFPAMIALIYDHRDAHPDKTTLS